MAPSILKKLTTLQESRKAEIESTRARLAAKAPESVTQDVVQARIETIKGILSEARLTHAEIMVREDAEGDEYLTQDRFGQIQMAFEDALDYFIQLKGRGSSGPGSASSGPPGGRKESYDQDSAGFPHIPLPDFYGRYEDWEDFHDRFLSIMEKTGFSDSTKLHYLKGCMKGPAANLLKKVGNSNADYEIAWQLLKNRYKDLRFLVNRHLRSLMALRPVAQESSGELRGLLDNVTIAVTALEKLGMPVKHWDAWLVLIVTDRIPGNIQQAWDLMVRSRERKGTPDITSDRASDVSVEQANYPKFSDLVDFLETRSSSLKMLSAERKGDKRTGPPNPPGAPPRKVHASTQISCPLCAGTHPLARCTQFREKSVADRKADVYRFQLCYNCLGRHKARTCNSNGRCQTCQGSHHTLLHGSHPQRNAEGNPPKDTKSTIPALMSMHAAVPFRVNKILLATARVQVVGPKGKSTCVRAFLDQGSEVSFISESVTQLLQLRKHRTHVPLAGLGASPVGTATSMTRIKIQSLANVNFVVESDVLVLPQLTSMLPSFDVSEVIDRAQFAGITLADPEFWRPERVDLVIGADLYGQLLRSGVKRLAPSNLVAQDTALGWVVSGPVKSDVSGRAETSWRAGDQPISVAHCITDHELRHSIQRFWDLEEIPKTEVGLKPEDEYCERVFQESCRRDSQGRYMIELPLKASLPCSAAETRRSALASLSHVHRRLERDPPLAEEYRKFMSTYEQLGHMSRIPPSEVSRPDAWYLPHHAVVSANALLRKIRVVFDASRRTRDGHFLNEFLLTGPSLQSDITLILLNWRRYRFVFTADIIKMFRQILIALHQRDFQRIVWSPDASSPPVDYRLNTVTYGTACAPYLAIRTLLQIANDEEKRYPLGAECLTKETYVDDIFGGADDLKTGVNKREQLICMLEAAGIHLDKWAANHPDLLPPNVTQSSAKTIDEEQSVKTLGVEWSPTHDEFRFQMTDIEDLASANTKRTVLSYISRLFDPFGWLAPITVLAKILMQDMWLLKLEWDTPLPESIRERWYEYCKSLKALGSLSIIRWLGLTASCSGQIHGFSDASSRAYAAVVYLRVKDSKGNCHVSQLSAKSKVAPVKTVSIPNLELCGAALLVKLILHVTKLEFLQRLPIFTWTDSQIVLVWLQKHPCHWKTFVANRVSLIQTELPSAKWAHVPTKQNPADLATRGVSADELADCALWWKGPTWLPNPSVTWPQPATAVKVHATLPAESEILGRFSSLARLLRFIAYSMRPLQRIRDQRTLAQPPSPDFLSADELAEARKKAIRLAQAEAFKEEIRLLRAGKPLPKRNRLLKLNPIYDERDQLLRVGGRLADAKLSFEQKHPPILPQYSALSKLFVRNAHARVLHGGPTLTASYLMSQVWILGRNKLIKSCIRTCVTCQKYKPHSANQLMGNLPTERVTPGQAFSTCGLDYAGPFVIRMSKGRGIKTSKAYVVVFVCFATRAIHLELVSDLTSAAFIDAYRRMVGRRSVCKHLWSDNATTFHGADKELCKMFREASDFYREVAPLLANDGTSWSFIPANSPHYGGLWEAGVKSMKTHLKKVVGEHILTYEEFNTVLVQIEACLNSRPLGALKNDPDDLHALTPANLLNPKGAFLIPEPDVPELPENRLSRQQLVQRIHNNFWKRWSSEYILGLQEREKWRSPSENFPVGRLVLIRDDRYPPAKWPMGRVSEVHPGPDGLVRVVTIKTPTNSLKRHIARLCPLFFDEN